MEKSKNRLWSVFEVGTLLLALLTASVFANGDNIYRLAVPVFILLFAVASTLVRLSKEAGGTIKWGQAIVLGIGCYFVARAALSEKTIFADRDTLLFIAGLSSFVLLIRADNRYLLSTILPWVAAFMIGIQLLPLIWQVNEPEFVPFRGEIEKKKNISGFFVYKNFFGLFIGVLATVIAVKIVCSRGDKERFAVYWTSRILLGFVVLLSLGAMLYSQSRGATLALAIGVPVMFTLSAFLHRLGQDRYVSAWWWVGTILGITIGGLLAMSFVEKARGISFFAANGREDLLWLAADCEPANTWIGGGARFFQDEAIRVWDFNRMNNTLGDPRVVHNEYVEAFINYGILGVLGLIFLVVIGLCFSVKSLVREHGQNKYYDSAEEVNYRGFGVAVVGLLLSFAVHFALDFSLHSLPFMMLFGMCLCWALRDTGSMGRYGIGATAVVGIIIVFGFFTSWPYFKDSLAYERARSTEIPDYSRLYEIANNTKDFELLKELADSEFSHLATLNSSSLKDSLVSLEQKYQRCADLSQQGDSFVMLGRVQIHLEKYREAEESLDKAIELAAGYEHLYGARVYRAMSKYFQLLEEMAEGESDLKYHYQSLSQISEEISQSTYDSKGRLIVLKQIKAHALTFEGMYASRMVEEFVLVENFSVALAYHQHASKCLLRAKRMGITTSEYLPFLEELIESQKQFFDRHAIISDKKTLKRLAESPLVR